MDEVTTEVVEAGADVEVSPIPWQLELALWFPVVCVFVWFAYRLFGGFWVDQPSVVADEEDDVPRLDPAGPNVRAVDPASSGRDPLDDPPPSH